MNAIPLPEVAGTNRHPVDQLGDIRRTIKHLQDRESDLKTEISALMGKADSLGGAEYIAVQSLRSRKGGLDEAKIAAALGIANLDAYRKPDATYVALKVERRAQEDA